MHGQLAETIAIAAMNCNMAAKEGATICSTHRTKWNCINFPEAMEGLVVVLRQQCGQFKNI